MELQHSRATAHADAMVWGCQGVQLPGVGLNMHRNKVLTHNTANASPNALGIQAHIRRIEPHQKGM